MAIIETLVLSPIREMSAMIAGYIPNLVSALAILAIGYLTAKVMGNIVVKLLKAIYFDVFAEKIGFGDVLDKSGIRHKPSELLGAFAHWVILAMVLVMTVKALGLALASQLMERIFAYIPHVVSAVFVLVLGMLMAHFVAGIIHVAAKYTDIPKPEALGKISKWAIVFFAATISLEELGISALLVGTTFHIFFGAVCFALALAYGLGGRDAAARHIEELKKRR